MRRWRARAAIIAPVLASCLFFGAAAQDRAKSKPALQEPTGQKPSEAPSPFGLVGVNSCTARNCHGSLSPVTPKRGTRQDPKAIQENEWKTWITHDKHAKAYEALLNKQSETIARNLAKIDGDDTPKKSAHEDARCLASIPCRAFQPTATWNWRNSPV